MRLTTEQKEKLQEVYKSKGALGAIETFAKFSPKHKDYLLSLIDKYERIGPKELNDIIFKITELPLSYSHPLEGVTSALKRLPKNYLTEIAEARAEMKGMGDTGLPKLAERILGTLRYLSAPLSAGIKTFVEEPVSETLKQVGASPKVAKTVGSIAGILAPVAGELSFAKSVAKLPGITKDVKVLGTTFKYTPLEYRGALKEYEKITKISKESQKAGIELTGVFEKLDAMKKLNEEQRELIKAQRGIRLADFEEALALFSSKEKYTIDEIKSLFGTLSGAYDSIRNSHPLLKQALFSSDEINKIMNHVINSHANTGTKISATKALAKCLSGELPFQSELDALSKILGHKFGEALKEYSIHVSKNKPVKGFTKVIMEVVNFPRAIMASADVSGMLRQGIVFMGKKEFWKNAKYYFKSMFTKEGYKDVINSITQDKLFHLANKYKLQLTDIGNLTTTEEMFMSNAVRKLPILGKVVEKSEQGYVAFLNKLRFDVFKNSYNYLSSKLTGQELETAMTQITRFINNATGRGETLFGVPLRNELAYLASNVFFAPRLMAGRINTIHEVMKAMIVPGSMHPLVRREILKSAFTSSSIVFSLVGLGALAGANVSLEPTSSDFMRIRIGDTRIDLFGGFQPYVVLLMRLITEKYTSSITDAEKPLNNAYGTTTSIDIIERFLQSKTSPFLSFALELLTGRDFTGKNMDVAVSVGNRLVPLIVLDIADMIDNGAPTPVILGAGALGALGAGIITYGPNDEYQEYYKDKEIKNFVDRKMSIAGLQLPKFQSFKTYSGVALTDKQRDKFMTEFANTVYPLLYKYLQDKDDKQTIAYQKEIESLIRKTKEVVGFKLFGINSGIYSKLVKHASVLTYNHIMSSNPNISPKKLRRIINRDIPKAINDLIQDRILIYEEAMKWLNQKAS